MPAHTGAAAHPTAAQVPAYGAVPSGMVVPAPPAGAYAPVAQYPGVPQAGVYPWAPPPATSPGTLLKGWPGPEGAAPLRLLVGAAVVGVLTGTLLFTSRAGINFTLTTVAAILAVAVLGIRRRDAWHRCLGVLALVLCVVPSLWDSGWLVALCLMGAFGLTAFVLVDGRGWSSVPLAVPILGIAGVRSLGWTQRAVGGVSAPRNLGSWLRGGGLGVVLALIIGALLASADEGFANVVSRLVPDVHLGELPFRLVLGVMAAGLVLAGGFVLTAPPQWGSGEGTARRRPWQEWGIPLGLVDLVIVAFLLVQATMLFGGDEVVLEGTGVTYADRAREGFGQLVVVTLIVLVLLGWTGRRCDPGRPGDRRLLAILGGVLVIETLLLVVSALRRMWLYEQSYGFTVLRVNVAAFEFWLAVALLLVAAAWWSRIARMLPRLIVTWAGVGLLALGLVSPEAVVASANVDRYQDTGKIDVYYLIQQSDDVIPALDKLDEPLRTCALAAVGRLDSEPIPSAAIDPAPLVRKKPDPWYAVNLSRARADAVLDGVQPGTNGAVNCVALLSSLEGSSQ